MFLAEQFKIIRRTYRFENVMLISWCCWRVYMRLALEATKVT
jgi:hypothetical protein